MRKIYTFNLSKEVEVEEVQLSKNQKGEEVKTLIKIKKPESHSYFIAKPNRKLTEESELQYNEYFWTCQKRGIMPASLMTKRYLDDGGILSKEQSDEYKKAYDKLFELQVNQRILSESKDKSPEDKKKYDEATDEIVNVLVEIQNFEGKMGNQLYQNTAENLARNHTARWWTLMLSHEEKDGKETPVFGAGDYESRLKKYDEIEEREDKFEFELVQRLLLASSLWYFNKAETQEDFDSLIKLSENQNLIEAAETLSLKEEPKENAPENPIQPPKPLPVKVFPTEDLTRPLDSIIKDKEPIEGLTVIK